MNKRQVLFVSDRTGLTAESYGKSLLSQFPGIEFESHLYPFIDTRERARQVAEVINRIAEESGNQPIVISTLVHSDSQRVIANSKGHIVDLFGAFIEPLEDFLGEESSHKQGTSFDPHSHELYLKKINAIEYTLKHDDGCNLKNFEEADVILVGVSRSGKTPTSLYLAMNFSLKTANYPMTSDDLDGHKLPNFLLPWTEKMVALTIQPATLSNIRQQRRPGSDYAALHTCQRELRIADTMFKNARIPIFDTTDTSIEEIAGWIVKEKRLLDVTALGIGHR